MINELMTSHRRVSTSKADAIFSELLKVHLNNQRHVMSTWAKTWTDTKHQLVVKQ